jgi:hypothetical protein
MPESYRYWFWHGGNKLKADVQEWTSLDRIKQSQVSGTPHAGGSFRSSMGQPYVLFSDLKYNIHMYVFARKLLPRGRELGQQVRPDCLVRIYEGLTWGTCVS